MGTKPHTALVPQHQHPPFISLGLLTIILIAVIVIIIIKPPKPSHTINQFFATQVLLINIILKASTTFVELQKNCVLLGVCGKNKELIHQPNAALGSGGRRCQGWRMLCVNPCEGLDFRGQRAHSATATSGPIQTLNEQPAL